MASPLEPGGKVNHIFSTENANFKQVTTEKQEKITHLVQKNLLITNEYHQKPLLEVTARKGEGNVFSFQNKSKYELPLSKNPPLPPIGLNNPKLSPTVHRIEEFILSHKTKNEQEAVRYMISQLDYVPIDEFQIQLLKTFNECLHEIGNEPYLILAENKKSNKWVTELSLLQTDRMPEHVVFMSDLKSFLEENPKRQSIKIFVLIDDAAYSGHQLSSFVKLQINALKDLKKENFQIHVVVPYVTDKALRRLETNNPLHIHFQKKMESAGAKIVDATHLETLNSLYFPALQLQDILAILQLQNNKHTDKFFDSYPEYQTFKQHPILKELEEIEPSHYIDFLSEKRKEDSENFVSLKENAERFNYLIKPLFNSNFLGIPNEKFEKIKSLYESQFWEEGFNGLALTIFDHKVADFVSIPRALHGEVWHNGEYLLDANDNIIRKPMFSTVPLYKNNY